MRLMKCLKSEDEEAAQSKQLDREIKSWIKTYNDAIKLLLLGPGESGKTTIIKQMKILHIQGYSASERKEKIPFIWQNIHESIHTIVSQLDALEIALVQASPRSAEYILRLGEDGPNEFDEEYFDHVRALWKDPGVKECFSRSNEYQLIDSAEYFLDRIDLVANIDYNPTDRDILQCRQRTTGIQKIEFTVKVPKAMQGGIQEFWMFDVGGQRGERKKWIQVFEGIHAVWFLVASSDFDQSLREDRTQNRLAESISLFEDVWQSRFLLEAGMIVFLNKQDILQKKIEHGKSIEKYFPQYLQYKPPNEPEYMDEYTKTKLFIKSMFVGATQKHYEPKKVSVSAERFINMDKTTSRECYYHFTVATDTTIVKKVFNDVHQIILTRILKDIGVY